MASSDFPPAIRVVGLRRSYGEQVVLDGVDLTVPRGSVYGLLGPNGAGKTTIVKVLSTLIAAHGGQAQVAGHDVALEADAVRAVIGVTGQFSAVDELLTPRENLELMADLLHLQRRDGHERVAALLDQFDLVDAADRPAVTLSGGMRRKLDLAMTLVGRPEVIFLDEPTAGLDPRSRRELWEVIRGLTERGVTILLTTQYLEEADHLASRVAVLDHGRIVAEGRPDELKQQVPGGHVRLQLPDAMELSAAAAALAATTVDERTLSVQVPNDGSVDAVHALLHELDRLSLPVTGLSVHTADLDDVFLALTGRTTPTHASEADR